MSSDPTIPPFQNNPPAGSGPPLLPAAEPPLVDAGPPPLLPLTPSRNSSPARHLLAILLSLGLGLFLADAMVSLVDDTLILGFDLHLLTALRGTLSLCTMVLVLVIYCLMGLTPLIPKRLFLPLTLFSPAALLVAVPCVIYFYSRIHQLAWGLSVCQVIVGLSILYLVQGGFKFRWPLMPESQLEGRGFSRRNLAVFLLVNVVVLVPAVMIYLGICAVMAVAHFSEGFLALRPVGLTVQVRNYVRNDGKTIQLVPMSHVGEPDFYRTLAQSFPSNAIILMEGVSDNRNLITNKINYQRMATALGVAEQHEEFRPRGELVRADVDVEAFTPNTIAGLNLAMLIHSQGLNAGTAFQLMQFSPPHFEEQLFDDLLRKRNRHLLEEIRSRLAASDHLIVPWGAAHMPEIAREIQKAGFHLDETQEYVAIRFRPTDQKIKRAGAGAAAGQPKCFSRPAAAGSVGCPRARLCHGVD